MPSWIFIIGGSNLRKRSCRPARLLAGQREVPTLKYYKIPEFLVLMIIPIGCFLFSVQFIRKTLSHYRSARGNGG